MIICTDNLVYTIKFLNHATDSSEYLKKLQTFCERVNTEISLFSSLDLHSNPIITALSQLLTFHENELRIYLHFEKIASSLFSTVKKILNMRDQKYYVKKMILCYSRLKKAERKKMFLLMMILLSFLVTQTS